MNECLDGGEHNGFATPSVWSVLNTFVEEEKKNNIRVSL